MVATSLGVGRVWHLPDFRPARSLRSAWVPWRYRIGTRLWGVSLVGANHLSVLAPMGRGLRSRGVGCLVPVLATPFGQPQNPARNSLPVRLQPLSHLMVLY